MKTFFAGKGFNTKTRAISNTTGNTIPMYICQLLIFVEVVNMNV